MRRFIVACCFVVAALMSVSVSPAAAAPSRYPDGVVGTYTYRDAGYRITIGYSPCGHNFPDRGFDPSAQFFVTLKSTGHSARVEAWAHSVNDGDFQRALSLIAPGATLTPEALAVVDEDQSFYTCAGAR